MGIRLTLILLFAMFTPFRFCFMTLPWFSDNRFPLFLAPMAGVTDGVFRRLCKEYGADVMVTEFVSAEGILQANQRTRRYTKFEEEERPLGIQLFGANGERMGEAARVIVERDRPDFIDINFGCPVSKVVSKNGGSSLLKDLPLLESVASAVVRAVGADVPVTAKIRLGWDSEHLVAVEVCRLLENCGIQTVTVHGRTKVQNYSGCADWEAIDECARAVSIPVVGNGDIRSAADADKRRRETAVKGLMIGRGAMECPWIFADARHYFEHGVEPPERSVQERWAFVFRHVRIAMDMGHYGSEANTLKFMRARLMAYSKGFPGAKEIRTKLTRVSSLAELEEIAAFSLDSASK